LHQRASLPSELLSLDLLRPFVLEKDEWFRTDSGTSYRLSKSKTSLSSRKVRPQPKENTTAVPECQQENIDFHRLPQIGITDTAKAFIGNELRGSQVVILANQCWTYCGFEISLASFAERKKEIGVPSEFVGVASLRDWKAHEETTKTHRQECLCYSGECGTK
jgi:hypothetical protein